MLSDYRGNSNPTPGAQASNKPILLAFDQSSQPVFDTLEVTGDFILASLTGILIADGVNPVTAEAELSTVRGGLGLDASGFAANTLLLADGAGGFTEVALVSGDASVTFDFTTPGEINIEAVGGGGGGDVTNPMDADLNTGGFLLFSDDPGVTIASLNLDVDNVAITVTDIASGNAVTFTADVTTGVADMLTVNGDYQVNVNAEANASGTTANLILEAVDNANANGIVTTQTANPTGATKTSAINSAGTGTIANTINSGAESVTYNVQLVPGATAAENLIITDGTVTMSRSIEIDITTGIARMQENAFAAVTNYQIEYTTDNGSGAAQISYELDGFTCLIITAVGIEVPNAVVTVDGGLQFTNALDKAGPSAGTITNAPTAGDPAIWLGVVVNGTAYACPLWAV